MMGLIMRTQLRLLLRGWSFWLLLVGGAALTLFATYGSSMAKMLMFFNELVFPFFLLAQMLLTAAAAGQERSERVEELIEALPYRAGAWVIGRYLAQYLVWLAASAGLWALGAVAVAAAGEPLDLRVLVTGWAVIAPVSVAFTTAAGFAIGSLVRGIAAYFLTAAVWVAGPFALLVIAKEGVNVPVPVSEYFASARYFALSWAGYFPNEWLLLYNRLFLSAIAVGAGGLVLWRLVRRRGVPGQAARAVMATGLAVAVIAAALAQSIWSGRNGAIAAELKTAAPGIPLGTGAFAGGPVRLDSYDLSVRLAPGGNRMEVEAGFDLIDAGAEPVSQIVLTLRSNLAISEAAEAGGGPLAITRAGDHLTIDLNLSPGESRRITMHYGGEVMQWRYQYGPRLAAHVAPQSILLPASYGWYPVPGQQLLTFNMRRCFGTGDRCVDNLSDFPLYHAPATFALKVEGSGLNLVSNAGHPVTGLYLIGTRNEAVPLSGSYEIVKKFGSRATVDLTGSEVVVSPANRLRAEALAADVARRVQRYQELVPLDLPVIRIIELMDSGYYGEPWFPQPHLAPGALLLYHSEIGQYEDRFWFGSDRTPDMVSSIWWPHNSLDWHEQFLFEGFSIYMEQILGLKIQEVPGAAPGVRLPDMSKSRQVLTILTQIEQAKGQEAAVAVLRHLRASFEQGQATVAAFSAEVSRVAGDLPELQPLLASLESQAAGPGR